MNYVESYILQPPVNFVGDSDLITKYFLLFLQLKIFQIRIIKFLNVIADLPHAKNLYTDKFGVG